MTIFIRNQPHNVTVAPISKVAITMRKRRPIN
jgi:hypothetical protein